LEAAVEAYIQEVRKELLTEEPLVLIPVGVVVVEYTARRTFLVQSDPGLL
jgi:hypothetical protein